MLLIYQYGQYWWIEVANTTIGYRFAGANLAERLQNVEAFADSLANGNIGIGAFLEAEGVPPAELADELLGTTTSVEFNEIAFQEFGEALMDAAEEVGTWILALFV